MELLIVCSVLALLVGPVLGFMFSDDFERGWGALIGLIFAGNVVFWAWVIFVAAHFITKYW
jgi:hypothetical protein